MRRGEGMMMTMHARREELRVYECMFVCIPQQPKCTYLSEHGLEEVRVPEPLRYLRTQAEGAIVVPQHMQTVRLCQHNPEEEGEGERGGKEKGRRWQKEQGVGRKEVVSLR